MADKDALWRLGHILHEIDIVFTAASHLSDEELSSQLALMRTVERCVEIISEATKHIPQDLRDTEPEIAWRKIVNIGNLLRHEYYRINGDDMIKIIRYYLPQLRPAMARLVEKLSSNA